MGDDHVHARRTHLDRDTVWFERASWDGPPLEGRFQVLREPWGPVTLRKELHGHELAKLIAKHEFDLVVIGPLRKIGMKGGGTLEEMHRHAPTRFASVFTRSWRRQAEQLRLCVPPRDVPARRGELRTGGPEVRTVRFDASGRRHDLSFVGVNAALPDVARTVRTLSSRATSRVQLRSTALRTSGRSRSKRSRS